MQLNNTPADILFESGQLGGGENLKKEAEGSSKFGYMDLCCLTIIFSNLSLMSTTKSLENPFKVGLSLCIMHVAAPKASASSKM